MIQRDSLFYEIFVQSFYDSNGDGIGDLNGVTARLDYLADLGIEGLWLMPIHPSPSYHKYDVTDYYAIHPDYGTMDDFSTLLREAHRRGIKVIIDLVINHCSASHPWFQSAIKGPDSPFRDYFIWATEEKILAEGSEQREVAEDSDNIFQWNEVPGQAEKYFSYFWSGMPDLNYDNQALREEIYQVGRYWLGEVGVDGFRLDAARHIYPDHRATDNYAFWTAFRKAMEEVNPEVFLVGEIWDNAHVVAPFLEGLQSAFNFDLGQHIEETVRRGQSNELVERYLEINQVYQRVTPDFIDATFLKNHDQNRIRSVFRKGVGKSKVAASILLTLPGTPFLYYGEELGMLGRKPDEKIREPFPWSRHGEGQTQWMNPTHSVPPDVQPLDQQQLDTSSIYHHYRKMIALRKRSNALESGKIESIDTGNTAICAYKRFTEEESLYVYHNLTGRRQGIDWSGKKVVFESAPVILTGQASIMRPFSTVICQ